MKRGRGHHSKKMAIRTWEAKESLMERPALERHKGWNVKCGVGNTARGPGEERFGVQGPAHVMDSDTEEVGVYSSESRMCLT